MAHDLSLPQRSENILGSLAEEGYPPEADQPLAENLFIERIVPKFYFIPLKTYANEARWVKIFAQVNMDSAQSAFIWTL